MSQSSLKCLLSYGQSPWLDFIQRPLVRSGGLEQMMDRWGIRGVTSNPSIFEQAIAHSDDYDAQIDELVTAGKTTAEIYAALVIDDIRSAADSLRPVYDETDGSDGFVSLEVSPHLVRDTVGTVREARRLWADVNRPNLMIKVPGTTEGLPAVSELIAEGINVNVTLLFSLERYREVIDAHLLGLERAAAAGRSLGSVASVASFFLSRIDTMVDSLLDDIATRGSADADAARALKGEAAIASARLAYQLFQAERRRSRFQHLAERGARPQRLLWASTGTKNADYSDIKYIEPLIGADTVSTMPVGTLEAYDDHGRPAARLKGDEGDASQVLRRLARLGIDMDIVTSRLLEQGITKFVESFDALQAALDARRQ
ncbi:MAG: transaldolase [Gammaproteobacteria bacterium]|jgi:transaldolase